MRKYFYATVVALAIATIALMPSTSQAQYVVPTYGPAYTYPAYGPVYTYPAYTYTYPSYYGGYYYPRGWYGGYGGYGGFGVNLYYGGGYRGGRYYRR